MCEYVTASYVCGITPRVQDTARACKSCEMLATAAGSSKMVARLHLSEYALVYRDGLNGLVELNQVESGLFDHCLVLGTWDLLGT